MALLKFGAIVVDARGKIGGTVFSRNGSGAIARAWTKPVQPNTTDQNRAKTNFGASGNVWNGGVMTEVQRAAWRAYASAVKWLNRLGETIILNGNSAFVQSATARITAGLDMILDGPLALTQSPPDETFSVVVDEATQLLTVTFDDTRVWAGDDAAAMSVFMGIPKNAGTVAFSGPYRLAGSFVGDSITPLVSPLTIPVAFPVVEGYKVTCRARICENDGRISKYFRHSSSVVA